ncbi:MAG: LuxR C-terminal-related transcriptional regulator [Pseudomonadota bacterium]
MLRDAQPTEADATRAPARGRAARSAAPAKDLSAPKPPSASIWRRLGLAVLLLGQLACAGFFVYDLFGGQLGLRTAPISWMARELIQVAALAGLIIGVLLTAVTVMRSEKRREAAEMELAQLSQAFYELMQSRFSEWGLTPAERDVGLFIVKGFSIQEIAGLRETSEGTVKAQMAAIYRKAGVSSRAQLVTLFIDHLLDPFDEND